MKCDYCKKRIKKEDLVIIPALKDDKRFKENVRFYEVVLHKNCLNNYIHTIKKNVKV